MSSSPKPDEDVAQILPDDPEGEKLPPMDDHEIEVKEQDRWLPIANGKSFSFRELFCCSCVAARGPCPVGTCIPEDVLAADLTGD
jgi:hypothetical protein